jgi:hypothetical protein
MIEREEKRGRIGGQRSFVRSLARSWCLGRHNDVG